MNENGIATLSENLSKGKPLNILLRILVGVSALAGIASIFLPFGKVMYYHPETFSILNFSKYETGNLLILLSIVIGIIANFAPIASIKLLQEHRVKKAITMHIFAAIASLVALCLFTIAGMLALSEIESFCKMRVDTSIAYYTSYICIFIPIVLNATSAPIIALLHSGKVSYEQMFGKKADQ